MVTGPTLPERIEVLAIVPMGAALKVIGRGVASGLTYDSVLSPAQLAQLTVSAETEPFDGDARLFRLGVESHRLGLAYEYKAVMPRFGEMAPQNKLFFRRIVREYGKDWPRYVRDLNALSDDDWSEQVDGRFVAVDRFTDIAFGRRRAVASESV